MRLVYHRDDPTPNTDGGIFCKIVVHVLRQPIQKILGHVVTVVGVGAGLAALDGDAAVPIRAARASGEVQIEGFILQRGTVRCVARGAGAEFSANLVLSTFASVPAFAPWLNSGGRIIQPNPSTRNEVEFRRFARQKIKACASQTISWARCWRSDARSQYARWSRGRL